MKLSDKIFSSIAQIAREAVKSAERAQREQVQKKSQTRPVVVARDGFQTVGKAPVSLGKMPSASAASDAAYVTSLYRDLLGREPDPEGMASHMRGLENGMTRDEIKNVFLSSPEFQQRVSTALSNLNGAAQNVGGVSGTTPGQMPVVAQGVGPVPLEGYDAAKLADLNHRTVKYQFGRVASHFSLAGVQNKQDAENLLKSMVPALEAAGLKVHEVKGDKIRVDTPLGQEWVDVVRGAGSGNPGWWWGSEGKAIPGTEGTGTQAGGGVGGTSGGGTSSGLTPLSTVPDLPEYHQATIDTSSTAAAVKSAAQWVKDHYPDLMARAADRQVDKDIMTKVIGILRANGLDATRVVNHPDRPQTDGFRYGSDAVTLGGRVWDVFGGMGETNTPQALDDGPADPSRPPE
jgi:hypothetical protein